MSKKSNSAFQMIADYDGDINSLFNIKVEGEIPILATRNMVLFPGVITPILVGRPASLNLINKLKNNSEEIFAVFCQKDSDVDNPSQKDLYEYGVYAKLIRVLDLPGPGNNQTAIVQGLGRCTLSQITKKRPYLKDLLHLVKKFYKTRMIKSFIQQWKICVRHQ
jgi:ATP-dependent Lon protease